MERDFDADAVKSIDSLFVLKSDVTSKQQGAALQAYAEYRVSAGPAVADHVQGLELAGEVVGRVEGGGASGDQADPLGLTRRSMSVRLDWFVPGRRHAIR